MLMSGIGLNAQEVTITLDSLWNWISYPNGGVMNIDSALRDFVPMEGDILKSRFGSSIYRNGHWRGRVSHFMPGEGYMYKSMRSDTSFVFSKTDPPIEINLTNITAVSAVVTVTMPESCHMIHGTINLMNRDDDDNEYKTQTYDIEIGSSETLLTNLTPNTNYHVFVNLLTEYCDNSIPFTTNMSFTTLPLVSTDSVTNISGNSATCWGTVFNNSGLNVIERGICWSKNNAIPTLNDSLNVSYIIGSIGMDNVFSITITNDLRPNTTYYVRAYAIIEQCIYYGDVLPFTTMSGIPVVSTDSVTDILCNSATCWGTVTNDGGLDVYERGICWSISPNPTTSGSHASSGTGTGSFSSTLTGLTLGTTYYVRAYATNSHTTAYGNEVSFTLYTIDVLANPSNGGTVSGGGTYNQGASCTLTATANTGYTFTKWTKNGTQVSTNASYSFTVTENASYVAEFSLKSYTISASASPSAGGTVSGGGTYNHGSTCTLTATANIGYTFTKWTKNGTQVSTSASYSFTVTGNGTYVANFIPNVPTGAINGKFTINSSGSKVYFSQGNLQYIGSASTPYWKFADNQWDCIGTTTGQNSSSQNVDRDLFGWGTSGYAHGAVCYQPWSTNTSYSKYYAYGHNNYHLYHSPGNADWGYNKISNGGNTVNSGWRTLTTEEWKYVLYTRNPSGPRFAKAKVNNVNGLILLPDDWNTSYYTLNYMNSRVANFSVNIITSTQWQTLEQHGAVFLPAAGYRYGTSVSCVDSHGYYWSASYDCNSDACRIGFYNTSLSWQDYTNRCYGHSVRLVRPVQN